MPYIFSIYFAPINANWTILSDVTVRFAPESRSKTGFSREDTDAYIAKLENQIIDALK
jgi:hypothetical protein